MRVKLRYRIIISVVGTALVASAILTAVSLHQKARLEQLALDRQMHDGARTLQNAMDTQVHVALGIAEFIAGVPALQAAFVADDRAGLLQQTVSATKALSASTTFGSITFFKAPAIAFARSHDPTAFGDDASGRRKTVVAVSRSGKPAAGIEMGRETVFAFGTAPVPGHPGYSVDVGAPFTPALLDQMKDVLGADIRIHVKTPDGWKILSTTLPADTTQDPAALSATLAGSERLDLGASAGRPAARFYVPLIGFGNIPLGVLELVRDTTAYAELARSGNIALAMAVLASFAAIIALAVLQGRAIAGPIQGMILAMNRLSARDMTGETPGRNRHDEVGTMARAVEVFRSSMIEARDLRDAQAAAESRAQDDKRAALQRLAADLEAKVGKVVVDLSTASGQLTAMATSMSTAADGALAGSQVARDAAAGASQSVQSVSAATEELSASISEIGQQAQRSTSITIDAVARAERTAQAVHALADAGASIGEVVQLIRQIAAQANLLALNATIEAARAGDAGRGFAIVANEVKQLAHQTAQAIESISARITDMQQSTASAVEAIQGIRDVIGDVSVTVTSIASAVEEQGAATREIARAIQDAATNTAEVSATFEGVSQAATDTGLAARSVRDSAEAMAEQSEVLDQEVGDFLAALRAA